MEVLWDDRHQPHTSYDSNHSDLSITPLSYAILSLYLVWRLFGMIGISHIPNSGMSVINLSCIEFTFGTELGWDNRHQPHTSLLWKLGCHGNQSETSITSLSKVLLSSYLVRRFLETIGISHIPHCYGNFVAIATTVKSP